jgi:hypothetical protein
MAFKQLRCWFIPTLGVLSFLAAGYKRDNTASENTDYDNGDH